MNGTEVRIGVLGAGSWGTTLAALLARRGHRVRLWVRDADLLRAIREEGENPVYLPGVSLPESLAVTDEMEEAASDADVVLAVIPSQFMSGVVARSASFFPEDALVVSAAKGIETSSLRRMDQVFAEHLSPAQMEGFTVLSGPSFAAEVAREEPTAVVVASRSEGARLRAQEIFQTDRFRVYTNPDVLGVELGGALKNVIALAAGVVAGLGFGHNTRAALITRGLAEVTRLGVAMGAQATTFSGLAGMGDLVLTCTGELSRNRTVGYRLGKGERLDEILADMNAVAEGIKTTEAVRELAGNHGVEMPISEEVHAVLTEDRPPRTAVENLMLREPKPERWS